MEYAAYATLLGIQHALIVPEQGCVEIGPIHAPSSSIPQSPPWKMDWAVLFTDGKYAYLYERWMPVSPRIAAGRQGYRQHFSFHYGVANPQCGKYGIPKRDRINYPPIIRIDVDKYNPHIHFRGEDHIQQDRVKGMTITSVDPFDFMRAVIAHRKTQSDFDSILNFQVAPKC